MEIENLKTYNPWDDVETNDIDTETVIEKPIHIRV